MNDRLIRALRREPVDRTPVWFMRQAGRALPAYREIRARHTIPAILENPELTAEVTTLPLRYFPADAVILFMDLATPFPPAGFGVEFVAGSGPRVDRPLETPSDVSRLRSFEPRDALAAPLEAIALLRRRVSVPVIGFVGAPFTLSSYLMPGATRGRRLQALKTLLWTDSAAWSELAGFWVDHLARFAVAQHAAGASVVQIFDSWAGSLAPDDYEKHVLPHSRALLDRLRQAGVPSIHFYTGNPALLELIAAAGGDAVGIDWRSPLDEAWERIGTARCAVQGNLDPVHLLAGASHAVEAARAVLARAGGRPGHIFNLGHGVLPETEPEVLRAVVDCVHRETKR